MPAPSTARAVAVGTRPLADRFQEVMVGLSGRLSAPLRHTVPADMLGYGVLAGGTFALDLLLLVLLDHLRLIPLAACVVIADVLAWGLHFQLNRVLNYRSKAPVGLQALRYGVVIIACLGISAAVTGGFAELGANLAVGRIAAGVCMAVVGYVACRWWVFRHR